MEQFNTDPLANPVNTACNRLGIGRTKFYELVYEGKIQPIKIGSRTLVPESELQKFISKELRLAKQKSEYMRVSQ